VNPLLLTRIVPSWALFVVDTRAAAGAPPDTTGVLGEDPQAAAIVATIIRPDRLSHARRHGL
jgi:hypothetical protein